MERDIEFRGKRKDNGQWIHGNLIIDEDRYYICLGINEHIKRDDYEVYMLEVIPETVGQYTGLHDKNGKEIYEGDIVKITFSEEIMPIVFNKARFVIVDKYNNRFELYEFVNNLEVIGNTTDNPELLESE